MLLAHLNACNQATYTMPLQAAMQHNVHLLFAASSLLVLFRSLGLAHVRKCSNFPCHASSVSELVPELIIMGCDITIAESDVRALWKRGVHGSGVAGALMLFLEGLA